MLAAIALWILIDLASAVPGLVAEPWSGPEPSYKVRAAMAYHGTRACEHGERGPWFERQGQKCKLFTEKFNKNYERTEVSGSDYYYR
jgi:hypothetical protein